MPEREFEVSLYNIGFAAFEVVTESIVQEGALTVFAFFAALDAIEEEGRQ